MDRCEQQPGDSLLVHFLIRTRKLLRNVSKSNTEREMTSENNSTRQEQIFNLRIPKLGDDTCRLTVGEALLSCPAWMMLMMNFGKGTIWNCF